MNKMLRSILFAAIMAVILNAGAGGEAAAQDGSESAVSQAEKADYSWLLTVEEVQAVTGFADLQLKSIDSKQSGEAADLTFSTSEGQRIVMVQILRGRDFDMYYQQFRSQDFKAWPAAFWGPKEEDPPSMFCFRKGDTMIMISSDLDVTGKPYIVPDMFVDIAAIIAGRVPEQGIQAEKS